MPSGQAGTAGCAGAGGNPHPHHLRAAQRSSFVTLVPSMVTPAMSPALVSAKAFTAAVALARSTVPCAPVLMTATLASAPAVQPLLLLRNLSSASCVMNIMIRALDCAPAWKPQVTELVL